MDSTTTANGKDVFFLSAQEQQQQQQQQIHQQRFDSFLGGDPETNVPPSAAAANSNYAMPQQQLQTTTNFATTDNNLGMDYGTESKPTESPSLWARCTACCRFSTYQAYFDVTTDDVLNRMKNSVLKFNTPGVFRDVFLDDNSKIPDAYGPFWISASLVFVLAVTSHIFKYFNGSYDDFDYKIHHLVTATLITYGFSFGIPILLYIAFTCFSVDMGYAEVMSIYGYSLVPYIPACLLSGIPSHALIWSVLSIASGISVIFILRNLIGPIMAAEIHQGRSAERNAVAAPLLGTVIGAHFIFLLILKLGFYHF